MAECDCKKYHERNDCMDGMMGWNEWMGIGGGGTIGAVAVVVRVMMVVRYKKKTRKKNCEKSLKHN